MRVADTPVVKGGDWFVLGIAVMELGAAASYLLVQRDWRQALVWLGVGLSNFAYLSMTRG